MINLLPPEFRKKVEREFFRRYLVVFGTFFISLVCAEIIFALVVFFRLDSSLKNYRNELGVTKMMSDMKKLETLEIKVDEIDHLIALYQEADGKMELFSGAIVDVLDAAGSSIKINELIFDNETEVPSVSVKGNAVTRADLLSFIARLEKNSVFEKVESPISNLLKNTDVDFSLHMNFNKNR